MSLFFSAPASPRHRILRSHPGRPILPGLTLRYGSFPRKGLPLRERREPAVYTSAMRSMTERNEGIPDEATLSSFGIAKTKNFSAHQCVYSFIWYKMTDK